MLNLTYNPEHKINQTSAHTLPAKNAEQTGSSTKFATDIQKYDQSDKTKALETAQSFETAFIAQMLQFSGLAKALTVGGGEAVESFTQFYLEELADDISKNGGFGIAEKIAAYIEKKEETHGDLGQL